MMLKRPVSRPSTLLLVLGALSLFAIALGVWMCALSGVAAAVWGRNLVAWIIGVIAASVLSRCPGRWLFPALLGVAVLSIALTLASPGQLGVHRWFNVGPNPALSVHNQSEQNNANGDAEPKCHDRRFESKCPAGKKLRSCEACLKEGLRMSLP